MPDKKPQDFATEHTLSFLKTIIQNKANFRFLEVGCGQGMLASKLRALGHKIVAIDNSEEALSHARSKGIEILYMDFLSFSNNPFDVLLFTRSLHHIYPLQSAVEKAKKLLNKEGLLIVEDFAMEEIDYKTARWIYSLEKNFLSHPIQIINPLKHWNKEHYHEPPLHFGKVMIKEIRKYFKIIETFRISYLYRYLIINQFISIFMYQAA